MEEELHHALDAAEDEEESRVIIITGAGRAFSAGYDMSTVREAQEIDPESMIARGAPPRNTSIGGSPTTARWS